MSPQRPQPRRSALAGLHPAMPRAAEPAPAPAPAPVIPVTEAMDTNPPDQRREPSVRPIGLPRPAPEPATPRTQKMTVNVPVELIDEAKNAFWADRGDYRTFSAWVAEALQRQIDDTMTRRGLTQLPARPGEGLPPGRPLK